MQVETRGAAREGWTVPEPVFIGRQIVFHLQDYTVSTADGKHLSMQLPAG